MTSQSKTQSNAEDPKFETENQEHERKAKKKDYSPPGWLITNFDRQLVLDEHRAQKFLDFRKRLCDAFGQDDERCNIKNLLVRAIDLLMENEAAILTETKRL